MWRVPPRCGRAEVRRLNVDRSIVECLLPHGSSQRSAGVRLRGLSRWRRDDAGCGGSGGAA
jgi:hypothetical protein